MPKNNKSFLFHFHCHCVSRNSHLVFQSCQSLLPRNRSCCTVEVSCEVVPLDLGHLMVSVACIGVWNLVHLHVGPPGSRDDVVVVILVVHLCVSNVKEDGCFHQGAHRIRVLFEGYQEASPSVGHDSKAILHHASAP